MSSFPAVSLLVVKCDLKPAVEAEFNCHSKNTIVRKFYSIHAKFINPVWLESPQTFFHPFCLHEAWESLSIFVLWHIPCTSREVEGWWSRPHLILRAIHTYILVTLSQGHMKACNSFHVTQISHMTCVAFEGNGIYYCISKNYSENVIILAISFTMVIFIYSILITHKVNIFKHFWSLLIAQEN